MDDRQIARTLDPVVRIGKNGLTENIHQEIEKVLKKRKIIKIKILNNCSQDTKSIVEEVIERSGATLVQKIGNVFTIKE